MRRLLSVVVVDDQPVVHAGLEAWAARTNPPARIAARFATPGEFLTARPAAVTAHDVVVCEIHYPGHPPEFDALARMCRAGHRVVVYSSLSADEIILRSLELGAWTFVAKSENPDQLCEALYAASCGRQYAAPRMAQALHIAKNTGRPQLSKRETEVLVAWFQTENKELVGRRLFIEPSTVCTHLQRVRAKYAAAGRPAPTKAALLARAIQDGILSADDL